MKLPEKMNFSALDKEMRIFAGIYGLCSLFLLTLVILFLVNSAVAASLSRLNRELEELKQHGLPDAASLERLAEQKNGLQSRYSLVRERFRPDDPVTENLLLFKENLFSIQERLQTKAATLSSSLPDSLGFADYDQAVPEGEMIPVLARELALVDDLTRLLLNSGVRRITNIELPAKTADDLIKESRSGIDFRIYPVMISFNAGFKELQAFLTGLAEQEEVYVVRKFQVRKKDKGLAVEILIGYTEVMI